jgi:hypothetical protein
MSEQQKYLSALVYAALPAQKRKERQEAELEVLSMRKVVERPKMLRPRRDRQKQGHQANQNAAARHQRSRKPIGLPGPSFTRP